MEMCLMNGKYVKKGCNGQSFVIHKGAVAFKKLQLRFTDGQCITQ